MGCPGRARRAAAGLFLGALAACGDGRGGGRPRSAVLITLDTTIPEALSCYDPRGATPHLDRLASEGVLYEDARSVTPLTLPSHASLLTGLYPLRHSVRLNASMALPEEARTLAELARDAGHETAAFVAAVVLNREFGLAQGFDVYDQPTGARATHGGVPGSRPAPEVVDAALAWLAGRADPERPFFLWVHLYDPHYPYDPPAPFAGRFADPYLAEVAFMDAEIGRLLDGLESRGHFARATLVAVADHGEGLGRHGEASHGAFVYDTTLAVPLLVRYPDRWGAGSRVGAPVSIVDLFPTLADALGLSPPAGVDGVSLFRRDPPSDRGVYFESYYTHVLYGWSPLAGWADGAAKYVHSGRPELFDVARDPKERRDVLAEDPGRAAPYRAALAELDALPRLLEGELAGDLEAVRAQIEELGYAGTATLQVALPDPLDDTGLPSPHERVDVHGKVVLARHALAGGRPEEAVDLLAPLAAGEPRNGGLLHVLARGLMETGRFEEAIPHLRAAAASREDTWWTPLLNLAACHEALGHREAAIEELARIAERGGAPEPALRRLVELLEEEGRTDEARRYRASLSSRDP